MLSYWLFILLMLWRSDLLMALLQRCLQLQAVLCLLAFVLAD